MVPPQLMPILALGQEEFKSVIGTVLIYRFAFASE